MVSRDNKCNEDCYDESDSPNYELGAVGATTVRACKVSIMALRRLILRFRKQDHIIPKKQENLSLEFREYVVYRCWNS